MLITYLTNYTETELGKVKHSAKVTWVVNDGSSDLCSVWLALEVYRVQAPPLLSTVG